jgi:hypothetical protein
MNLFSRTIVMVCIAVLAQFRLRHVKQKQSSSYHHSWNQLIIWKLAKIIGNHYNKSNFLHYILEQMQSMLMTNKHKM